MRLLFSLCLTVLVAGCSVSAPVATPPLNEVIFEVHAVKGSIKYIAGELRVDAVPGDVARVHFRIPVRSVELSAEARLAAAVKDGDLVIWPQPGLASSGGVIQVALLDGRRFPLRMYPMLGERALDERKASLRLASLSAIQLKKEMRDFLVAVLGADRKELAIPGVEKSLALIDKLAFDTKTLRGTFMRSYKGKSYTVHVVEVTNRLDQPQEVPVELFQMNAQQIVYLERTQLEGREIIPSQNCDRTNAYIVVPAE